MDATNTNGRWLARRLSGVPGQGNLRLQGNHILTFVPNYEQCDKLHISDFNRGEKRDRRRFSDVIRWRKVHEECKLERTAQVDHALALSTWFVWLLIHGSL